MTVETVIHRSYGTKTCLASAEEAQEDLDDTQCELDCAGLHRWPTIDPKPTTIEVTREMLRSDLSQTTGLVV
jgi:hypothetical protein